jgi:ESCRT-II complex subunit VPS25
MDLIEAHDNELFFNKKIDRKCSNELLEAIFDLLVKKGRGEWCLSSNDSSGKNLKHSPKKNSSSINRKCYVLWFTFEEWANLIYDYVNRNGLRNTVCTIFELIESDEVKDEQFHNMDKGFFKKCLAILQQKKKAELIYLDQNSEEGVKFF